MRVGRFHAGKISRKAPVWQWLLACLFQACLLLPTQVQAVTETPESRDSRPLILVGGYDFPPYIRLHNQHPPSGLSIMLLDAIAARHPEYRFLFVPTSIHNRYAAFSRGRFQMMLFENPQWGWSKLNPQPHFIPLPFEDSEIYIAKAEKNRDEQFFNQLNNKQMLLVEGYHYPGLWQELGGPPKRVRYVSSNHEVLQGILKGRADIAPLTRSMLERYLAKYPNKRRQLMISGLRVQHYDHHILLAGDAAIKETELIATLEALRAEGVLEKLSRQFSLPLRAPSMAPRPLTEAKEPSVSPVARQ